MQLHVKLLVVGMVLMIGGVGAGLGLGFTLTQDPSEDAVETMYLRANENEVVRLDEGEYQIWVDTNWFDFEGTVTVKDAFGSTVWSGPDSTTTETWNNLVRVGTFEAKSSGFYNISTDSSGTYYITEPISNGPHIVWAVCGGLLVGLIGGIVFLVGLLKLLSVRRPGQTMPPMYPPSQYPPPQQPPQHRPPPPYPPPQ